MRQRILIVMGILLVVGIALYLVGVRSTKLHISVVAEPLVCIGGERANLERCASGFPFTNGLLTTVIVDVLLVLTAFFTVRRMQLIPRGIQNTIEAIIEGFYNFAKGVDAKNIAKFFPFTATAFFFMLYANLFGLVPGVGSIGMCVNAGKAHSEAIARGPVADVAPAAAESAEPDFFASWPASCPKDTTLVPYFRSPSADLNNTLAFALIAVFLVQVFGFQALGLGYLTKFFNFKEGGMGFFLGVLELISEVVRIISFAFRLFGNIFAGEVILVVMAFLFPYLLPAPFYGFEIFVAVMQAIVFAVLSLVFMSLATQAHGGHDDKAHAAAH